MRSHPTTEAELVEYFQPPRKGVLIQYSRFTKDYICFVNGSLMGYAPNYADGRTTCDEAVYDQLAHDAYLTAVVSADIAAEHAAATEKVRR